MEVLRPPHFSPMPHSSFRHSSHPREEGDSFPQSPSPSLSHSPIASPPSALLSVSSSLSLSSVNTNNDCACDDFWFGYEDSLQTKIIHERYMEKFDLSTTRKHASRAPIAFIGLIIRRRISKEDYYQIIQSDDCIPHKQNGSVINHKTSQKKDNGATNCCKSNETHCESCRLYTIDEIIINQRDCVPLGFTMKKIRSSMMITIWDNNDGLPLHQHRLHRWPQTILNKNNLQPHSYIECSPLYDDDPTGLHCTDASFVYSTHQFKTSSTIDRNVSGDVSSSEDDSDVPRGYASMNQHCILDALRRFGRPSNAEAVRQLNASGKEGDDQDPSHPPIPNHPPSEQNEIVDNSQQNGDDDLVDDDAELSNEEDEAEDDNDDDNDVSDAEESEDNVDDENDRSPLPSPTKPNSIRRHHTDGTMPSPNGDYHRNLRRSKSLRSQSSDEADAAKLMAQLGLGSFGTNHNNNAQHCAKSKYSTSTEHDAVDDELYHDRCSDDEHFSSADDLNQCDGGWNFRMK